MTSLRVTRAMLEEIGAKPSKKLGQNFLINEQVVRDIVRLIDPKPEDQLIEIGGGLGTLTDALVPRVGTLVVFEVDRLLHPHLVARYDDQQHVTVLTDALTEWASAKASLDPSKPVKIAGNIPYQITGPLLERAFSDILGIPWQSITLMVQKEVAERMFSSAGDTDRGKLSVIVEFHSIISGQLHVTNDAFHPKPQVDSMVIQLTPRPVPLLESAQIPHFQAMLDRAFHMRRKTVWNNLRDTLDPEAAARLRGYLEANGVPLEKRPQDLTLREWLKAFWVEEELRTVEARVE